MADMGADNMAIELPAKFEWMIANAHELWYETRGMTPESLRELMEQRVIRDRESPRPGDDAPIVELELLSETGARTGEMVKLSDYFGKPLGLIFGSYT